MAGPAHLSNAPPGYDTEDPYEGEDLSTYPDWWRENIEEHREYGLRPYRPPRLSDGVLTPPLVEELEAELDVTVAFSVLDPEAGGNWALVVDGERVCPVERQRLSEGYTEYGLSAAELEARVRAAVDGRGSPD